MVVFAVVLFGWVFCLFVCLFVWLVVWLVGCLFVLFLLLRGFILLLVVAFSVLDVVLGPFSLFGVCLFVCLLRLFVCLFVCISFKY